MRAAFAADFDPVCEERAGPFAWYAVERRVDGMLLVLRDRDDGFFVAHAYPYAEAASTFIVECDPGSFARSGFDRAGDDERARRVAAMFADVLAAAPLIADGARWVRFVDVRCGRWPAGRVALLGDALHTTHYVLGAGTRLAFEDAIALEQALADEPTVEAALAAFERDRRPVIEARQRLSRLHQRWYARAGERARHLDARGIIDDLQRDQRGLMFDLETREAGARLRAAGGRLAGRVLAVAGAPIEGAQVSLAYDPAAGPGGAGQATAFTGADGRFELLAAASGPLAPQAILAAFAPGHEPTTLPIAAVARFEAIEVRLAPSRARAALEAVVRLRFAAGAEPPALVEVRATDPATGAWSASFVPLDPDNSARARVEVDHVAEHILSVRAAGYDAVDLGAVRPGHPQAFEAELPSV